VVAGFDLFDRPSTLRKMLPKLVRSVAVDAIDKAEPSHDGGPASVRTRAAQFLAVTAETPQHRTQALGLGDDVRLTAPQIAGAALAVGEHVVHISAFAL
jgi:hypothetical protein